MTLDDLLSLREVDVAGAEREAITGYGALSDLDAVDLGPGVRVHLRGDDVVLVYIGQDAFPAGLDHAALVNAAGGAGDELRSRQGKSGVLHVVGDRGLAWSEANDEVGYIELFPPMTLDEYLRRIYVEPPQFVQ